MVLKTHLFKPILCSDTLLPISFILSIKKTTGIFQCPFSSVLVCPRTQYTNSAGVNIKQNEGLIVLYEPAMILEYAVLPFIGIGGGVGYRLMLKNNKAINERFTAPTYKLVFSLKLGVLYKQLRAHGSLR